MGKAVVKNLNIFNMIGSIASFNLINIKIINITISNIQAIKWMVFIFSSNFLIK